MFIYFQSVRRKRRKDLDLILPFQGEPIQVIAIITLEIVTFWQCIHSFEGAWAHVRALQGKRNIKYDKNMRMSWKY